MEKVEAISRTGIKTANAPVLTQLGLLEMVRSTGKLLKLKLAEYEAPTEGTVGQGLI
jgi:hypothetical protein